jgi:hypothetical protein
MTRRRAELTRRRAELRMDAHGLKVKNPWWTLEGKHVIGWDEVRWVRDNPRFSRRTRWMLEIVLKNGSTVQSAASSNRTPSADPQTLEAIRRAARHHAIPAVLTGRPVERWYAEGSMPKAGLYPDPGGEPGLRDWDGTEWSRLLHTEPAAPVPGGTDDLTTTWSPLPKQAQQQHAESAAAALKVQQSNVRFLRVLTWIVVGLLVAGFDIACSWLATPGAGIPGGVQAAAVWATNLFLALCTAGLPRSIRGARQSVLRHQQIAEAARQAASRASAHDVQSHPETTWIVSGPRGTELRMDDHEITLRTRSQTRWIAWDDVRWFRDGKHFHLSRRLRNDGWALVIALKDGREVIPDASRKTRRASQATITAVREAAAHHSIPAVLTGRPVPDKPSPADRPGLYPDPGGEPALREWTGTEWLPSLLADPATSGPHDADGLASIWSPLSKDSQQRQWDAAIAAIPRWNKVVLQTLGMALLAAIYGSFLPIIVIVRGVQHGYWLGLNEVAAILLYAATVLWTCGSSALILLPVRHRRVTAKVARAARAASAQAAATAVPPSDARPAKTLSPANRRQKTDAA